MRTTASVIGFMLETPLSSFARDRSDPIILFKAPNEDLLGKSPQDERSNCRLKNISDRDSCGQAGLID